MTVRIIQLGTPRAPDEGTRIGAVRRPPRGVPRSEFATRDWYDVWFPLLAPSVATMQLGQSAASDGDWNSFTRRFRSEMNRPDASRALDLLAALSRTGQFAIGCYCDREARCHRSVLRELLLVRGADIA